jgi:hypothetical protein
MSWFLDMLENHWPLWIRELEKSSALHSSRDTRITVGAIKTTFRYEYGLSETSILNNKVKNIVWKPNRPTLSSSHQSLQWQRPILVPHSMENGLPLHGLSEGEPRRYRQGRMKSAPKKSDPE